MPQAARNMDSMNNNASILLSHAQTSCVLTIHDEKDYSQDILLNPAIVLSWKVSNGTRLRLSSKSTSSRRGSDAGANGKQERIGIPKSDETKLVFFYQELASDALSKYPNLQISISKNVAESLDLVNRSLVIISQVGEDEAEASHVEIGFRDAYLTRADMWRLVCSELAGKAIYKGQKITFLNSIKVQVKSIYRQGTKLTSGFFTAATKPIFRSESARYVIFLQMSKEMWDFEPEGSGEIMLNKVVDGFLPELFRRWSQNNARHLISIVLFTRMEYTTEGQAQDTKPPYKDFYRVLTSNMESNHHENVLLELKRDFKTFLRDVSTRSSKKDSAISLSENGDLVQDEDPINIIQGHPAPAIRGNILEAINTASSQFSEDYIDRDLLRTGLSIVVVSPGSGVFEVDAGLLNLTTDLLVENGVGIDLVCLARMPLHSVPLLKYRKADKDNKHDPGRVEADDVNATRKLAHFEHGGHDATFLDPNDKWNYAIPHWLDVSYWTSRSTAPNPRQIGINNFPYSRVKPFLPRVKMYEIQMMGIMENETNSVSVPYLAPYSTFTPLRTQQLGTAELKSHASSGSLRHSLNRSDTFGTGLSDSLSTSHSPRSPNLLNNAKSLSNLVQWMEAYDTNVFDVPQEAAAPPMVSVRERSVSRPPLARPQTVDSRIMPVVKDSLKELTYDTTTTQSSQIKPPLMTSKSASSTAPVVTRQTSNASLLKPGSSLLGSIKGGRPFGFKGFGGMTTKATASVEISSETAQREFTPTHGLRSLLDPARITSSSNLQEASKEDSSSARSSIEEEALHHDSSRPSTEPIAIRTNATGNASHPKQASYVSTLTGSLTPTRHFGTSGSFGTAAAKPPVHTVTRELMPWFTMLNPCNPSLFEVDPSSRLGRWHHVFPKPLHASTIKWKSLCAPASIPLTTESFPSAEQLATDYEETTWTVVDNSSSVGPETNGTDISLFRELISARLTNGYQIVIGPQIGEVLNENRFDQLDVFNDDKILIVDQPFYVSRGMQLHRLTLKSDGSVRIQQSIRIRGHGTDSKIRKQAYTAMVKTNFSSDYKERKIIISKSREAYDWKRLDNYIADHEQELEHDMPAGLHSWRARYVLIPTIPYTKSGRASSPAYDDNEEEIRLEGIYKLTQIFQKNRYMPIEEPLHRVVTRTSIDSNPLDIIFRTKPPSEVVASELHDSLLEKHHGDMHPRNLLPESELLTRTAVDLRSLATILQSDKGIKMQDRRWHFTKHSYCFIAIEFVTWLVDNFRDIESREQAVEFGDQLMKEGLFQHVEKRHNFRDGNFFFQLSPEYRPKSVGMFSRLTSISVPQTPTAETKNSPRLQAQPSQEDLSSNGTTTPTEKQPMTNVLLSKKLIYDVDRKKKSYRKELIDLHYDRVSSADDCYHLRINWLNVTPKLVEDAVSSWAKEVEKHGLRLIEIPLSEASRINELHTFRSPYVIKLARQPPERILTTAFDLRNSFTKTIPSRFTYHKALLKKFNFVLDLEAAKDFPEKVEVMYSWGKPDYNHPQFVSRDGLLLVQITDDGNFLLLANRLSNNRRGAHNISSVRPYSLDRIDATKANRISESFIKPPSLRPISGPNSASASPLIRAVQEPTTAMASRTDIHISSSIKEEMEKFCGSAKALEKFYDEVRLEKVITNPGTPEQRPFDIPMNIGPVPPLRDIGLASTKQ